MRAGTMVVAVVLVLAALPAGCRPKEAGGPAGPEGAPAVSIRLATTTSTENSGLLDVLLPEFRRRTGIEVQVMPMGTGRALKTGSDGNCDVVLVHAPQAEEKFVADGWGVRRRQVMYNDFVLLGPASDAAGIQAAASAPEALKRIAAAGAVFVSRGDNSGTHKKEQALWAAAGVAPSGRWYRSVGKGMGETLTMADQMGAYTLADRGTFIKFRKKISLAVLVEGDKALHNPYGVIAVNPAKHPHVKYDEALKFIEFLTSDEGRRLIGGYKLDGEVLFHPWPAEPAAPATARAADRT